MSTSPVLRAWTRSAKRLYALCEENGVGITVMKPFAGGRLFDAEKSPFGAAMTPVQACHYCLTRPAVASVLAGFRDIEECAGCLAYETADDAAKNYASILADAPQHAISAIAYTAGIASLAPWASALPR